MQRFRTLSGLKVVAVIRIVIRPRTHGQDLPGLRVHHDDVGGVRLIGLHDLVELVLHHMLNRHFDRQCYIVAVDRGRFAHLISRDVVLLRVALDHAFARHAAQQLVHLLFHARHAVAVIVDEAEDVRGELVVRIKTPVVLLENQAVELERAQLRDRSRLPGSCARSWSRLRGLNASTMAAARNLQCLGDLRQVDFGMFRAHQLPIEADVVDALRLRQDIAVAVEESSRASAESPPDAYDSRSPSARNLSCWTS